MRGLVTVLIAGAVVLVGCSSGDDDEALTLAVSACNDAMVDDAGLPADSDLLETRQSAADSAAKAAQLNPEWDALAVATNEWAQTLRSLQELDFSEDNSAALAEAQEITEGSTKLKADVSAQCRKVSAAGGDVDKEVLNDF